MHSRHRARHRPPALLLAAALLFAAPAACTAPAPSPTASATPTPSPSSPIAGHGPTTVPTVPPQATAAPSPTFLAYTVAPGDTLVGIARRFDTTWQSLVFWNRDRYDRLDPTDPAYDVNRIDVGWQLVLIPGLVLDYEPIPDVATPTPILEPASPTPVAGGQSQLVSHGNRGLAKIALTFDMGGRVEPALDIMAWLLGHDVPATLFMTGAMADNENTDAGRQVLAIVAEHPELFELGNHSYSHPDFRKLTAAQMSDELRRTEEAIGRVVDLDPAPLFRPPYGGWNDAVLEAVGKAGYSKTVMWDVDTIDWRPTTDGGPTADDIVAKVVSQADRGSIVLMHLGGFNTLAALPRIVSELRSRGYELVTVGELLGL